MIRCPIRIRLGALTALLLATGFVQGAVLSNKYALFLADAPVGTQYKSRAELGSAEALAYRTRIETAQASLKQELDRRGFRITGSASTLLNAVFVAAPASRVAELQSIPGVVGVVRMGRSQLLLNRATSLINGPQAWNLVGGLGSAGAGVKIGVLDTGIDQTHPALQDNSLQIPAGFPKCNVQSDCASFTSNKVIVARSYVSLDAAGSDPKNPAADSQPDDYSARDRVGHGTAVATSAAGETASGAVTINGMAPKAWLGSYKVGGSPGVNSGAGNAAIIQALEDAVNDGMDVITISLGGTAFTGPLDTGSACGNSAGVPCDPLAYAFEQAAKQGVTVLAAAGNEGNGGPLQTGTYPQFNTISSPADAPSVIAVGAVSNTHGFNPAVEVTGAGVPANLNSITASFTDAFSPYGAYAAPLVDLTQIGDSTGQGCGSLPAFSLLGAFALIQRGGGSTCTFDQKMGNATAAGALGVIFYDNVSEALISPSGLSGYSQPALFISLSDGTNLKTFIDSHPGYTVTIDPAASEVSISGGAVLAGYSSLGPALGTNGIKPELLAPGGGSQNGDLIYMGAQNYDPLGEVYSSDRYIAAAGTSFATPLTAGAAALVKQKHPGYTGQQVKSALVNTASQSITTDDTGLSVNILQTGAGLVAADAAVQTNVTIVPSTVSFGSFATGAVSQTQALTVTNTGSSSASLAFSVQNTASASGVTVSVTPSSLTLAAGQSGTVTAGLSGTLGTAGLYYGSIAVKGGAVPLNVPFMFISPTGTGGIVNLDAASGDGDTIFPGQQDLLSFQLTDGNGAPLVGVPVIFSKVRGSIAFSLSGASTATDNYGYAYVTVTAGSATGNFGVNAVSGGQSYQFTTYVDPAPAITSAGVLNSANGTTPIAPGSYATIYGSNLSYVTDENYSTVRLPLSMDQVTVSFDAAATGSLPAISVPGYLTFVSPGQVNIQVPWELQGYSSAQMKVTLFESGYGNVVTVPIANYAPAIFEISTGVAAALDQNNAVITSANPAARGTYIEVFCNGLGPVTNTPASGNPAKGTPLSATTTQPTVTIGGVNANVIFSGLTPTLEGLYQINVQVPASVPAGNQPIVVSIGGATAKTSNINLK